MTAGVGTAGCVLAETCVTGELDRNFIIIHTSSGTAENIMGDWKPIKNSIINWSKHHRRLIEHAIFIIV